MMHRLISFLGLFTFFAALVTGVSAWAEPDLSQMASWPIGLQDPATPAMEHITAFHDMLLYIITGIVIFVTALMLYVMVRFNAKANPVPSTTTHNVMLEVLWTVVPVVILIVIAVPSFKLLFFEARNPEPDMIVRVTGHQWNWEYEYPDFGDVSFTANMLKENEIDASKGQLRLLSTDAPVVLPVNKNIVFEVRSSDVIHAFAVPAFGIKIDAMTGRMNSTWARATKTGTFYGQCSEICGKGHGFMPIEIKVVEQDEFEDWIVAQGGTIPESFRASEDKESEVLEPASSDPVAVDLPVPAEAH